jgi:hypothetical protein
LSATDYLKFASLQMAAEATFLRAGMSATDMAEALERGNDHASRFVPSAAAEFAAQWEVLDERDTNTGFSGTLFRNKGTGEIVMSFRSTEFIDDAARDNQATNAMEIKEFGFAFGQMRDMEDWYKELTGPQGKLTLALADNTTHTFSVTGYSLGGHLATAFNIMRQNEADTRLDKVVTFNSAGVGGIEVGKTLNFVRDEFKRLSENADGNQFIFSDPELASLYANARGRFSDGLGLTAEQKQKLTDLIKEGLNKADSHARPMLHVDA